MNHSGFFARVRSDARRNLPSPGYGSSTHREPAMEAPQTISTRSPRTGRPVEENSHAARAVSSAPESPLRFEQSTRRTSDSRVGRLATQSHHEGFEARETETALQDTTANAQDRSDITLTSEPTIVDETTETLRKDVDAQLDVEGHRQPVVYDEHEPVTASDTERQTVREFDQDRYVKKVPEMSNESDTLRAGSGTDNDVSVSPTDVGKTKETEPPPTDVREATKTEPPPSDNHRYTIGREQTETPTHSPGSTTGQREVKPPRLHIGEVVIRVEEDPKPQRAKRRGRTSTLSDSQRLIRSL